MPRFIVEYSDGEFLLHTDYAEEEEAPPTTRDVTKALRFFSAEAASRHIETWVHYPSTEDSDELWNGGLPRVMSTGRVIKVDE